MPAYIIVTRESPIRDQSALDTYSKMNRESPRDPNITSLVIYGAVESLEGDAPDGGSFRRWKQQRRGTTALRIRPLPYRKQGADYRAFIVEGL